MRCNLSYFVFQGVILNQQWVLRLFLLVLWDSSESEHPAGIFKYFR